MFWDFLGRYSSFKLLVYHIFMYELGDLGEL